MGEQQATAEKDLPLSSQVLEYYRNYSQSHQLPRYLCGEVPNTIVIPERTREQIEIGDNIQSASMTCRPPLIGQDHTVTNVVPPTVIITDADNRGQVSPTSSITSNRKLEWDNGADIGYENCEVANRSLFKSSSLPALNTLERNLQKDFLRHSPDGRIAEVPQKTITGKNSNASANTATKLPDNFTSTSSTTINDNQNPITSTSDQSSAISVPSKQRIKVFTSSSSSNSSDVKDVIYVPVLIHSPPLAESTPNISGKQSSADIYYETPVILQPRKPPRKNPIFSKRKTPQKSKSTSFENLQSLKKLEDTLEQRKQYFQKYLSQKQQKLCITKPSSAEYINKAFGDNVSIAIQTENVQSTKKELIYLDHYVSDKEDGSSTDNSSKIVDCNSFEYLYGSAIDQEEKSPGLEDDIQIEPVQETAVQSNNHEILEFISNKLRHSKAKSDLTNAISTETNASDSKSVKISSKLSNNLISDVEKSVDLLTRLLHSKKYDDNTKKYYIRKIVHKIVDSKYVDDRTSSTTESTRTDKTTNESNTSEIPEKYPTQCFELKLEPPLVSENRKIKSETNLQDVGDIYPRLQRNPRFTLTNNEFFVGQNKGEENDNTSSDLFRPHSRHVFPSYTTESSIEKMQDTNRSSACNRWKDEKTASERLMEAQKYITDESDELVGYAQRERQSQLNWISNEINHLSKLKSLLENKEFKGGPTQSTAVYMITTDKNNRGSSRQSCNCHNRSNTPHVVSTSKTPDHHHIKLQRCSHNQQEYRVRQLNGDRNPCSHRGHATSCPYQQEYARNCHRTCPTSTSAVPTSSEDQPETSIQTYKVQADGPNQHVIENPSCTSAGVTCTLLPSRAAIVSLENQQNISEMSNNIQGTSTRFRSSKQPVVLPKSTSVPNSISSSQKLRSATFPVQSAFSNRNVATFSASKTINGDQTENANNAKLISSEVYQSMECPTTSVRRYVFEIPIMDSHSNQETLNSKKSSNIGVNKTAVDLGRLQQVDFEVRTVHVIKEDENETPDEIKPYKSNYEDEMKQLKNTSFSENQSKSVSGKVLSQNKVASFEIGPSISREIIPNSSDKFSSIGSATDSTTAKKKSASPTSIKSENSGGTKQRERNKTTQIVEVRLKEGEKVDNIKRNASEKSSNLDNEESLRRSTGSQTISLENYMQKLIAETMKSNNWSRRKGSSDHSKATVGSSKEIVKQNKEKRMKNSLGNSGASSKKKSDQAKPITVKERFDLDKDINLNGYKKSESTTMRMSEESKSTTDSDKERFIGTKERNISATHRKSDSSRKKSQQKDFNIQPASTIADEYQHSYKHIRGVSSNREAYDVADPDRFKHIKSLIGEEENMSSAVFVPIGSYNFKKSGWNREDIKRGRSLEKNHKNIPSENASVSNASGSKNKDSPDSSSMGSKIGQVPLKEEVPGKGVNNEKFAKNEERRSDYKKNEIVKSMPVEKRDSHSNSSESKTISDFSSNSNTFDATTNICQCCRSNNICLGNLYADAIHHPLCQTCYQIHQHSLWRNSQPYYMFPNHTCNCYTLLKTQQIQAIKTTINQLQSLEFKQPNACVCPPHRKLPQQDNKCLSCNCPIKLSKKHHHHHHHQDSHKTRKSSTNGHFKEGHKNGAISYTLKLETATEDDITEEKSEDKALGRYEEEVVVKVPNKTARRGSLDEEKREDTWKQRNDEEMEGEEKENDNGKTNTNKATKKKKTKATKTLQEYLSANRPTFIESAEQRRRCLIELAYMREERCQKYKQLLAMTNGVPIMRNNGQYLQNNGLTIQKPRIFSTKEMKRLTAKNYKKLPEVQQRLFDKKDRQLKKANRLLSDIFNKKLRDKVLKGQPSLSTSISVINLM